MTQSTMLFCPLYSGSRGNMLFLEGGGVRLVIDCGFTGTAAKAALDAKGIDIATIDALLVTHDHSDHTHGVGVLARKYRIPVYANAGTFAAMAPIVGNIPADRMRVFESEREFYIGELNVLPVPTPHDAAEPVGFVFTSGDKKLSVFTDIGCFEEDFFDYAAHSSLMLLEANHDVELVKVGPYPYPLKRRILGNKGHLSNDDCAKALIRLYNLGVRRAILGHLSDSNNIESLAMETVRQAMRSADIPDDEFSLYLAHRDKLGDMFEV